MSTVLALVVLVGALTCPAHMLWRVRRGKQAACWVPARRDGLAEPRARQQALGDELAVHGEANLATPGSRRARD